VLLFMAVTGFTFSVMRAGIMILVYLIGIILQLEPDSVNSLGLATLIVCFINPFSALDAGFLLSLLACLGIVLLSKFFNKAISDICQKIKSALLSKSVKFILSVISVTFSATVFTLPVNILYFGKLCLIAPLSNLIITNLATFAMLIGGVASIIPMNIVTAVIIRPLMFISGLLCKFVIYTAHLLSKIPFAYVSIDKIYGAFFIVACAIIFVIAISLTGSFSKNIKTAVAVICCVAVMIPSIRLAFNSKVSDVTVNDVGNGIAVMVSDKNDVALIGCGGSFLTFNKISNALDDTSSNDIDYLLIPRNKTTEISALEEVTGNIKCKNIISAVDIQSFSEYNLPDNILYQPYGEFSLNERVKVRYINNEEVSVAFVTVDNTAILILFYPGEDLEKIPESWIYNSQILVSRYSLPENYENYNFSSVVLSSNKSFEKENVYSTFNYGTITIRTQGDTAYQIRSEKNA
ncbi:MAG: ComEC/Rec2 family competence protein, partial [Clostridiales bacterium]|nr:ComEC/Rec2 family competence protein [Clostridiales bacterium]